MGTTTRRKNLEAGPESGQILAGSQFTVLASFEEGPVSFKLTCPKCGSTSCGVERERRPYVSAGEGELLFSCRCGKQLFGAAVETEVARQYAAWEKEARERTAKEREREARRKAEQDRDRELRAAHARQVAERKRTIEQAARQRRDDEMRRWRENIEQQVRRESPSAAQGSPSANRKATARTEPEPMARPTEPQAPRPMAEAPAPAPVVTAASHPHGSCAWADCGKPARENSVYCSRDCSNKNARFRHSQRKGEDERIAS